MPARTVLGGLVVGGIPALCGRLDLSGIQVLLLEYELCATHPFGTFGPRTMTPLTCL